MLRMLVIKKNGNLQKSVILQIEIKKKIILQI